MAKETAWGWIDKNQKRIIVVADTIWGYAELGLTEVKSSALLQDELRKHGFKVEAGVAGMPTAFIATWGSGKPVIGIMGEFDALPGISNKVEPVKTPLREGAPGHGCGHHIHGTSGVAGAIAARYEMEKKGVKGTVKFFGTPAEENFVGKVYMVRAGLFDGTIGHVPQDNTLRVDQVFATWSNIADLPLWFSVGRRPSTGGSPTHVRRNEPPPGNGGVPGLLVDYAFDGMTVGYAPEVSFLPGAYAKFCYGRGFEAGYSNRNDLADTDMIGVQVIPVDIDPIRIDFQWNRGFNIFDDPNNVKAQLGDIDWYGLGALSTLKNVGIGNLNLFASTGMSITHPNGNVSPGSPFGLLSGDFNTGPEAKKDKTGYGVYLGARYDLPSTRTKLGVEYNYGSKNWIPFDPAADDMWSSKLGTRGHVYEAYLIQELKLAPVSSYLSKVFFRLGYQYYDFQYTGSNNWVGAPTKISDLTASNMQFLAPLKNAQDIYATFEVKF